MATGSTRAHRADNKDIEKDIKLYRRSITIVSFCVLSFIVSYAIILIVHKDYEEQTLVTVAKLAAPLVVGIAIPGTFVINRALLYMESLAKRYGCFK